MQVEGAWSMGADIWMVDDIWSMGCTEDRECDMLYDTRDV